MDKVSDEAWETARAIDKQYFALKRQDRKADLSGVMLDLLDQHEDEFIRDHIRFHLISEYCLHGNFAAATDIRMADIAKNPLSPMPVLGLVGQKHYAERDLPGALAWAIKAVELADTAREYRRLARAKLLRVAADLGDTGLVRTCLIEIMDMTFAPGEPDVAREADLLVHAKAAGVERETLYRYRDFLGPVELPITAELPQWRSREEDV